MNDGGDDKQDRVSAAPSRRGFLRSVSGTTAMAFAITLPALLGATGIASDFAIFNMKLSELQSAADQAAIAAAKEMSVSASSDGVITEAAKSFAAASLKGQGSGVATDVAIDRKNDRVSVKLTEPWSPFFAHFLGAKITPVIANATAALAGRSNVCMLSLDPSGPEALMMDNKSHVTANGCGVYVNSIATDSLSIKNNSVIKAAATCTAGGVSNNGSIVPPAVTDCPVVEDPLANRNAPSFGACDFNKYTVNTGTVSLVPGTYCGGLKIGTKANVTLAEGTYVIKDGPLDVSGAATLSGDHVGFYLTGKNALLALSGTATVNLSGGTKGDMAGLLFFEDRTSKIGRTHIIRSTNAHKLTGTIYMPRGILRVDPGSKVSENSAYTAIIANRVEVDMGPELVLNSDYGSTDVPVPTGLVASNQVVLIQ